VPKSIAELEDLLMHSRGRVVLEVLNRSGERIRYTYFTY